MAETFNELYRDLSKEVFLEQARQQVAQGADTIAQAQAYAEQGKPDFTLAYLLLAATSDEIKRDIFARSYERRAILSDERAEEFDRQYHRPFPLIKLEAQKDRLSAQQVQQGKRVRRGGKAINMN